MPVIASLPVYQVTRTPAPADGPMILLHSP